MAGSVKQRDIGDDEVLYIEDLDGLIALVQASVLEIHPWGSTLAKVEAPDRITVDLDPGEDVPWTALIDAANEVRERLRAMRLESFVKTTGGKGLHVVVPLTPKADWDTVESLRARSCGGNGERHPGQVHGHHLEARARREDLHRLLTQRAGCDRSRSLLRPRPGRRPCFHATGLERALAGDPTQPLHGGQPTDALAASRLRSVGKDRLCEAVAPERRAQEATAGRPWVTSWSTPYRRDGFPVQTRSIQSGASHCRHSRCAALPGSSHTQTEWSSCLR